MSINQKNTITWYKSQILLAQTFDITPIELDALFSFAINNVCKFACGGTLIDDDTAIGYRYKVLIGSVKRIQTERIGKFLKERESMQQITVTLNEAYKNRIVKVLDKEINKLLSLKQLSPNLIVRGKMISVEGNKAKFQLYSIEGHQLDAYGYFFLNMSDCDKGSNMDSILSQELPLFAIKKMIPSADKEDKKPCFVLTRKNTKIVIEEVMAVAQLNNINLRIVYLDMLLKKVIVSTDTYKKIDEFFSTQIKNRTGYKIYLKKTN